MAPPSAERAETSSASLRLSSSPLVRGLGSVGPVILMILLLLLCFPFKRKKRQLSTRTLKRDLNTSELISMTKLEGGLSPDGRSLEDGKLHKGTTLPIHQAERQTNGFTAELQEGNANSLRDVQMVSLNHQRPEKPRKLDLDHQAGRLGPPASSCPNSTPSPNSLQLRKLPMTPKEAHISRMELLNQGTESQVYESIRDEEMGSCPRGCVEGSEGSALPTETRSSCAVARGLFAGSVDPGGRKDPRTARPSGRPSRTAAPLQCDEQDTATAAATSERDAPLPAASDMEKRLSAMYARVRKKPRASQQLQPANPDGPVEQEEEAPPPIPEKCFENIYESLSFNTEGGEVPGVVAAPEA